MKQAERAEAIIGHGLHAAVKALVKGDLMEVSGGENLGGQQQRGDRQRAPSGTILKPIRYSPRHNFSLGAISSYLTRPAPRFG